jgi:hypothetical protein
VDFTSVFDALNKDVETILRDPTQKPKNDWQKLHNFVYRICTCACNNAPEVHWYGGQSTEGQEQPQTLYYLHRQKVAALIEGIIQQVTRAKCMLTK